MTEISAAERVYLALSAIPSGCWSSYGDIARLAGLPRRARFVGQLLSRLPEGSQLPWHRVMNAQGRIAFTSNDPRIERQLNDLAQEGLSPVNGRFPASARWQG